MHWYAIRSKPNKEMALSFELAARKIEVYFPRIRVQPVNPRSRTVRPYFPGYLFVHVDLQQMGFSELNWVPFSQGMVSFGAGPTEVPEILIQTIRKRVEAVNAAGGEQLAGLKQGDAVVLSAGPFRGYSAIFDLALPGAERVRVLLKMLSRQQIPLEVPAGFIEKKIRR
jgi:transcriptional antiterminator RfaH